MGLWVRSAMWVSTSCPALAACAISPTRCTSVWDAVNPARRAAQATCTSLHRATRGALGCPEGRPRRRWAQGMRMRALPGAGPASPPTPPRSVVMRAVSGASKGVTRHRPSPMPNTHGGCPHVGQAQEVPPEFRAEAVKLVTDTGQPVTHVAAEIGVGAQLLGRWVQHATQTPLSDGGADRPLDVRGACNGSQPESFQRHWLDMLLIKPSWWARVGAGPRT